jgi:uncharacterized surface anchored protein
VKNENEYSIKLEKNKVTDLIVENEYKKGALKIVKQDKEDESKKLAGVKFELYNYLKQKIGEYVTDSNGEILVENLKIGNYILKEINTNAGYVLDSSETAVIIEYNKTNTITLTNSREKGKIRIIKQDRDNENIKLAGVKFELLDEKLRVIEELTTNESGEVVSSNLDSYESKYYLREKETLDKYVLDKKLYDIEVVRDEITDITIENEYKKR